MENKTVYKRFFSIFLIILLGAAFPLFADPKNIVYSQVFDFSQIDSIDISLTWENLVISQIYGDEISVEIGCNNLNKIPEVLCQDGVFIIQTKAPKVTRGIRCTVYLYLPQDFLSQSIKIQNASGNIQADTLRAQNAVALGNVSGRIDIASCTTELYNVTTVSGNATLQKIKADYFDFSSTSGTIFAELVSAPLASSGITNVSGRSQLYIPKDSNLYLSVFSVSGSVSTPATISNSPDAPQITITSVSGKIDVKEY